MLTPGQRSLYDPLHRCNLVDDRPVNRCPIAGTLTPFQITQRQPGNLEAVDIPNTGAGQPEYGILDSRPDIDQAKMREQ